MPSSYWLEISYDLAHYIIINLILVQFNIKLIARVMRVSLQSFNQLKLCSPPSRHPQLHLGKWNFFFWQFLCFPFAHWWCHTVKFWLTTISLEIFSCSVITLFRKQLLKWVLFNMSYNKSVGSTRSRISVSKKPKRK